MKPDAVKQALNDTIQAMTDCKCFSRHVHGKDNTRNRKFPFHKGISSILAFRGGTINQEIMVFGCLRLTALICRLQQTQTPTPISPELTGRKRITYYTSPVFLFTFLPSTK